MKRTGKWHELDEANEDWLVFCHFDKIQYLGVIEPFDDHNI